MREQAPGRLTQRLVGSLHMEALLLADEARAYFDDEGRAQRDALPPLERVSFSCEALKVTTRLMHVIAWLLARREGGADCGGTAWGMRARAAGSRRLGRACESDPRGLDALPPDAHRIVAESMDLYERVARLDRQLDSPPRATRNPARELQTMLERAF